MLRTRTRYLATFVAAVTGLIAIAALASKPVIANQKPESPPPGEAGAVAEASVPGRFAVVAYILGKGSNDTLFLLDVSKWDKDGIVASVAEGATGQSGWTFRSIAAENGRVQFEIQNDQLKFLFDGVQTESGIRGELVMPSGFVAPTRLQPTTAGTIGSFIPPEEDFAAEKAEALRAEGAQRATQLLALAEKHPESPLALDACFEILRTAKANKTDASVIEKAAATYVALSESWGRHLVRHSSMASAELLSDMPQQVPLALHYITAVEASLTDQDPPNWRRDADVIKGYALIQSEVDSQRKEGAAILWKRHDENIFDTRLTSALLSYEQTHGDLEKAIELAAQFAAFPPTARMNEQWTEAKRQGVNVPQKLKEQVAELWVKKHGNKDGLEKYLDQAYLRSLGESKAKELEPRTAPEGDRAVLVELFTGSSEPTCFAADMALSNVASSLPPTEVVVLRYQENIPEADPLTVLPGAQRADYYEIKSTPAIFVNGSKTEQVGGFRDHVAQVERLLREAIDPLLGSKSNLKLDLKAENLDGLIVISAEADGLNSIAFRRRFDRHGLAVIVAASLALLLALALLLIGTRGAQYITSKFDTPWMRALLMKRVRLMLASALFFAALALGYQLVPREADVVDLRLRLAVVEDGISFAAPNGVRVHDRVLRAMLGGAGGVPPLEGRLRIEGKLELAQLRKLLLEQIKLIEENFYVKFSVRPPIDLKKLSVVAFVQNDSSREVLQAASVSLEGSTADLEGAGAPQTAEAPSSEQGTQPE